MVNMAKRGETTLTRSLTVVPEKAKTLWECWHVRVSAVTCSSHRDSWLTMQALAHSYACSCFDWQKAFNPPPRIRLIATAAAYFPLRYVQTRQRITAWWFFSFLGGGGWEPQTQSTVGLYHLKALMLRECVDSKAHVSHGVCGSKHSTLTCCWTSLPPQ